MYLYIIHVFYFNTCNNVFLYILYNQYNMLSFCYLESLSNLLNYETYQCEHGILIQAII